MDPFHDKVSTQQQETAKRAVLQLVLKSSDLETLTTETAAEDDRHAFNFCQ
jgi:hypothetical protein